MLSSSIQQAEPIKNSINFLKRSQNENKTHSAKICVICDRFIKSITIFSEQNINNFIKKQTKNSLLYHYVSLKVLTIFNG